MSALKKTFERWIAFDEIEDPVLRYFGVALAIAHLLTIVFYLEFSLVEILKSNYPVCWPFLPNCFETSAWSPSWTYAFVAGYALVATVSAYAFLSNRLGLGWIFSFATLALKMVLMLKDYRLMGNYHYMIHIVHFLFLFYPMRRFVLPLMVVAIYVAAGSLKFNFEWLSGAALLVEPLARGPLLVAMCAYVVILEMVVAFGLLSSNRRLFLFSLAQFFIFHVFSYGQVGFFYPSVMFCLLAVFYLPLILRREGFVWPQRRRVVVAVPILVFALAQVAPMLYRGEPSLTGQGRLFSLNMFDARTDCQIAEYARFESATVETNPVFGYMRIRCDPAAIIGLERSKCDRYSKLPGFRDLDLYVNSKKNSGEAQPLLRIEGFCRRNVEFNIWKNNDYIL